MLDRLRRAIKPARPGAVVLGLVLGLLVLAPVRMADSMTRPPGSLDPSFGTGGMTTLLLPAGDFVPADVVLRPDGKVVVAGYTDLTGEHGDGIYDFFVAEFTATGAPDRSFGVRGLATVDLGATDSLGAMALQPDGKLLVAGSTVGFTNKKDRIAIARLNPDGRLDSSFGDGGRAVIDFCWIEGVDDLAVRPDGRIVLAGLEGNNVFADFGVAQLTAEGKIDTSFGKSGCTAVDFGGLDLPAAVALQPDGKIVVAGTTSPMAKGGVAEDFAISRINPGGLLDRSFGRSGKVTVGFHHRGDHCAGLAVRPDGAIVLSGATESALGPGDLEMAQLRPNGSIDTSFGVHGHLVVDFGSDESDGALALRPDGESVLAGSTNAGANPRNLAVALIDSTGTLDRSFGQGGRVSVDLGEDDTATAVAIQPDGRIVVAGRKSVDDPRLPGYGYDFAVARLLGTPLGGAALSGSIVSATVLGHGVRRVLDVKVLVSKAARAQVRLLKQDLERLHRIYPVKSGANELKARLPSTVRAGVYKLELTLRDARGQQKIYRADLRVPA